MRSSPSSPGRFVKVANFRPATALDLSSQRLVQSGLSNRLLGSDFILIFCVAYYVQGLAFFVIETGSGLHFMAG